MSANLIHLRDDCSEEGRSKQKQEYAEYLTMVNENLLMGDNN
jgi:hypothetical protein